MATLWAKTVTYDSVQVGDGLPILVKYESQDTIDLYDRCAPQGPRQGWHNLHTDEEYAGKSVFGGTVNMGEATVAYVAELLEKAFPVRSLMSLGSRLEMRATEPIRPGDTITFTGQVTGKRKEKALGLVDCEIICTNQSNKVVARAQASIPFPL